MAWAWIGVTPFFVFALMFLIVPTLYLVVGAFQDPAGNFTLANLAQLFTQSSIRSAYWISIKVSLASATFGGLLGFALAYAAVIGGLPQWIRPTLMTFSGVASNFAGLPLAFAFLATLGRTGLVTTLLVTYFDFNIYSTGFNLLSFWGLTLTYLYFQIPLMVLIITPALDGLKREWREASPSVAAGRCVSAGKRESPRRVRAVAESVRRRRDDSKSRVEDDGRRSGRHDGIHWLALRRRSRGHRAAATDAG